MVLGYDWRYADLQRRRQADGDHERFDGRFIYSTGEVLGRSTHDGWE